MSPGRTLVVATGNAGKLREIREILAQLDVRLVGLESAGDVSFPEEGDDYAENARNKALAAAHQLGLPALADDSGLEVAGLGGRPGPHSARYGGPGLDDRGRAAHLLEELGERRGEARRARFVCIAALAHPDGRVQTARGECEGVIAAEASGSGGFGYDPIFRLPDGRTLAEVAAAEKNRISHRARALQALREALVEVAA